MIVTRLELVDFRNYANATFDFQPGTTAVVGLNGQGKTNLAEAMAYLATLDSFRGAPLEALIRVGADTAVVRATVVHDDGREVLVELELSRNGRNRVLVNRQKLGRARDLLGVMRVTRLLARRSHRRERGSRWSATVPRRRRWSPSR